MDIELIVRVAAGTAALILAVALGRAPQARLASRVFGAALCLGAASYVATSGSPPADLPIWTAPFLLLATEVSFFFWGWTTSIMDDGFQLSPLAIGGAAILLLAGLLNPVSPSLSTLAITLHSVLGIGFVIAALVNVLRGWRQDLLEARRRLRAMILICCGGGCIAFTTEGLILAGRLPSPEIQLLNAVVLAVLLLGLTCTMLDVNVPVQAAFGWTAPAPLPAVEPAQVPARDREQELIERLDELMTKSAAYRDAELAVTSLASRLGVAEKKLREVINRQLGFKNFSAYVNAFRLEEVRRRLLDARHDQVPILTMALEAGFGSIVAFNRAFKEKYAMTPTAYRAQRDEGRDGGAATASDRKATKAGDESTSLAG